MTDHNAAQQLEECRDLQSVVEVALARGLELTGADRGNLQLMDWKLGYLTIAAHRGFGSAFLNHFARVDARDGTVCGRAMRAGRCVIVEDVFVDPEFVAHRAIAEEAGFRAVQSTPVISPSGAFLGVLSTHFHSRHRSTASEIRALSALVEMTATAIILQRIRTPRRTNDEERIGESLAAIESSWELLRRTRIAPRRCSP